MAVSNGRQVSETPLGNGKKAVKFADTIKMSTYLVCFVVGKLEATEAGRRRRHAAADRLRARASATWPTSRWRSARSSLRFFTDYYGIPYPGDKLDMIALPDFAAGAMENLGAITYRETALLVDTQHRLARRSGAGRGRHRPRDRPHVVRRPGDDEVVERHLAERGVRHVHGDAGGRRVQAGVAALEHVQHQPRRRRWRPTASTAPARSSSPSAAPKSARACSTSSRTRRARRCCGCWSSTSAARSSRRGIALYLKSHEYGNAETTDLWDAHRGGDRRAEPQDHGLLDLPGRPPGRERGEDRRRQRADRSRSSGSATSPATTTRASSGRCR